MALQHGRCKNCGSIISVDITKEDAVCMFCWAHTSPKEAVAIEADPSAYEFPNEEMNAPTAEEQAAAFAGMNNGSPMPTKKSQPAIKKTKEKKLSPAEKVALAKKELYEPSVPNKTKLLIAGIGIGAVALITALALPLSLARNSKREAMRAKINTVIAGQTLKDANYSLEGQGNNQLTVVVPQEMSEAQAQVAYQNFKQIRAEVYGLKADDGQKDTKIKIYASNALLELNGSGKLIKK